MERFYFTFGSSELFPYQNTYLVIVAEDVRAAIKSFREKYPDRTEGCLNCSDYYNETQWKEETGKYYADRDPACVLYTENCFGKKPAGYDDLFIFVPDARQIVRIAEGTGTNLLDEDIEAGFVDYLYIEQYALEQGMPEEDGGDLLLEELARDKYSCLADAIPDILDFVYGDGSDSQKTIVTAKIL